MYEFDEDERLVLDHEVAADGVAGVEFCAVCLDDAENAVPLVSYDTSPSGWPCEEYLLSHPQVGAGECA